MKKQQRSVSPFNLSFLDIMFCGFGAVVLLVLIINANIIKDNEKVYKDVSAEVDKVAVQITVAKRYLRNIQEQLSNNQGAKQKVENEIAGIESDLSEIEQKSQLNKEQTLALNQHIKALKSDLKRIEKNNLLEKKKIATLPDQSGKKVRQYEGDGNRQYLTGLKLGGKRVAIILDSSASMLDETLVNIIIKRNLSREIKQTTRKWQQAINTVRWLIANLPEDSRFMVLSFNEKVTPVAEQSAMKWISTTDSQAMDGIVNKLFDLVPEQGTNFYKVFYKLRTMKIKPDNIILITDGLPTQGSRQSKQNKVSAVERIELFNKAIKFLPDNIPVNTILLPMEGDPMAASLFWKLAIDTGGSFLTPSRDWP